MIKEVSSLENLDSLDKVSSQEPVQYVRKVDDKGRAYATGKRKGSIARVWLKAGSGKVVINNRQIQDYLVRPVLRMIVEQPFGAVGGDKQYDVNITVVGGGLSGQAGAIKHGISKALLAYNPDYRKTLKDQGFLTRDSRVVERKKYGRAKARKSYQFSKR